MCIRDSLITDHNVRETLLITNKSYVLSEGKILAYGSSKELADNQIVKIFTVREDCFLKTATNDIGKLINKK